MIRSALRSEVRLCIKRDTNGFADSYINTRLDWAQEDLGLAYDWAEMFKQYSFTLTHATSTYSFPTGMKNIYDIRVNDTAGQKLIQVNPRTFDTDWPLPSLTGEGHPTHYVDYGDHFEVFPTPDTNYTLCYIKCSIMPTAFASDASSPDLTRKDRLIVALATMYCFEALQEAQLALYWQRLAQEAYAKALEGDRKPKDWIPQARPFNSSKSVYRGETWKNPFVRA